MQDHVYKIVELAGSSETSIDDAILTAISRASSSLRHLRWFEVQQIRGHIEDGEVSHYQVVLKVGFTLDDDEDDEDEDEDEEDEEDDEDEEDEDEEDEDEDYDEDEEDEDEEEEDGDEGERSSYGPS